MSLTLVLHICHRYYTSCFYAPKQTICLVDVFIKGNYWWESKSPSCSEADDLCCWLCEADVRIVRIFAVLLKKSKIKSSTEKQSSATIVHQAKRTTKSTRTTHTSARVSKMGFWMCGSGGVFESCTIYLHDGRANRGCPSTITEMAQKLTEK